MGHTEDADWDWPAQAPQGDPSGQGAYGATKEIAPPPIYAEHRASHPGHQPGHPQRPRRAQNLHETRPHPKARQDPHLLPFDLQEHRLLAPAGTGAVQQGPDLGLPQRAHAQPPAAPGLHLPGQGGAHGTPAVI